MLPDRSLMNCLPLFQQQIITVKIKISTITLQERAANVINSTTLAVEIEPNVCVCVCVGGGGGGNQSIIKK